MIQSDGYTIGSIALKRVGIPLYFGAPQVFDSMKRCHTKYITVTIIAGHCRYERPGEKEKGW